MCCEWGNNRLSTYVTSCANASSTSPGRLDRPFCFPKQTIKAGRDNRPSRLNRRGLAEVADINNHTTHRTIPVCAFTHSRPINHHSLFARMLAQ